LEEAEKGRGNKLNLPQNTKNAVSVGNIASRENECIITVADNSGIFLMGKDTVSKEDLAAKISEKLKGKTTGETTVYLESASDVQYGTIAKVLSSVRQAKADYVGLVVQRQKQENRFDGDFAFLVKLAKAADTTPAKPNPLFLRVSIKENGDVMLNVEKLGTILSTENMTAKLAEVFKSREESGVFREGTNVIEKTVYIKPAPSMNYGSIIGVVDAVKGTGAEPIILWLDDLDLP
jgi:biopolymer transport protein ExbD